MMRSVAAQRTQYQRKAKNPLWRHSMLCAWPIATSSIAARDQPTSEFRASTDVDGDLFFQSVGVVRRGPHVLDMIEQLLKALARIAQHNQAIPGITARAPKPVGLVAAESWRQSIARPKKIDRAGLPVILRKNSAARTFCRRKLVISLGCLGHDFLP